MNEFKSGAKRSEKAPNYWMIPPEVEKILAERYDLGALKYAAHNWKKAMNTGDLEYIRQFDSHLREHGRVMFNLCSGQEDPEGETLEQNIAALVWNAVALAAYALNDKENFMKAFDQRAPK